jgi:hypothetical protein
MSGSNEAGAIREGWNSRFESAWANRNQFIEAEEEEKPMKQGRARRGNVTLVRGAALWVLEAQRLAAEREGSLAAAGSLGRWIGERGPSAAVDARGR